MHDLKALLDKAKWERLDSEELEFVVSRIEFPDGYDLYTLLHILGRGGSRDHRYIVEKFLEYKADPLIAALSLRILCTFWGLTRDYLDWVKRYVDGEDWDRDDEVKLQCLSIAGEYLRTDEDRSLLASLLDTYEDNSEFNAIRGAAYFALARAAGKRWEQLPPAGRLLDFEKDIDRKVVSEARRRLGTP